MNSLSLNRQLTCLVFSLVFLFLLPVASAAIVVDSFSCNSQTTTASVENGEAMNCNAVLLNNDLQNAVSVNQVSLAVSGGWAEQSSYTVSLNTNIGAGQSKSVGFQNIRSTTPGSSHKFLHIDIDGTAHTEQVDSLSVNAVALKSLSLTSSASSVTTGGSFDVTSTVIVGGSYTDVTLTLSLSGCSFGSNELAGKSIGAMNNNAQATRSWTLTQGSTTSCSVTVSAAGTATPVLSTKTKTVSVANPTGSDPASSGSASGGSGGAGGSSNNATNATVSPSAPTTSPSSLPDGSTGSDGSPAASSPTASSPIDVTALDVSSVPPVGLAIVVVLVIAALGAVWFLKRR